MTEEACNTDAVLSPEDILLRQRREQKELQAKIAALKRSITKGDKKRKKEVQAEVAVLEAELSERHEKELAAQTEANHVEDDLLADAVSGVSLQIEQDDSAPSVGLSGQTQTCQKKPSKAQKRRDKKADQEKEHQRAVLEEKANAKFTDRHKELTSFNTQLADRGLRLHEIAPDGNCLYNAIAHQLLITPTDKQTTHDWRSIRETAADYLRQHKDDFLPFLTLTINDDDEMNAFEEYCAKVRGQHGPIWGGEAELRALSLAYGRPIQVFQADGAPLLFGDDVVTEGAAVKAPLVITFHRHAYQLGAHYNSTRPIDTEKDGPEEECDEMS